MPLDWSRWGEFSQTRLLIRAVTGVFERLAGHTLEHWNEFVDAFPFPFRMLNAVIGWATGLTGIVLTAPISAFEDTIVAWLRHHRVGQRLIRIEDAIRIPFEGLREILRLLTFSGESSLVSLFLGWVARFLWTWGKRAKLISGLIRAKTEAELFRVLVDSYKRKFRLLRLGVIILAVGAIALFVCLFFTTFGVLASTPRWLAWLLPQDTKRVYSTGTHQHRVKE